MKQVREIEKPLYDKHGNEIGEFDVLKMFHFTGVNEQGRGRKHYYMYKGVTLKYHGPKNIWVWYGIHLSDPNQGDFPLRVMANKETRVLEDTEVVQKGIDPDWMNEETVTPKKEEQ